MSRIVLICAPTSEHAYHQLQDFVAVIPPTSILTVAACLERVGHKVILLDADGLALNFTACLSRVLDYHPDYIGVTAMTATMEIAASLCECVKKADPKIITIFGGIHVTALPVETIEQYPFVDFVVRGEGEYTLPKLIQILNSKDSPDELPGITFRKGSKIIDNPPPAPIANLDDLPSGVRAPVGVLYTARGCYRNCTFCSSKTVLGRGIRYFSISRVMEELDILVKQYKIRILYIQDDTFTVNKKRSMEICEEIIKRGYKLEIMIAGRCDEVDMELYQKLRQAGVNWCCFGVESGNQSILDSVRKNITLENVYKSFAAANKVGFHIGGNFMLGFPGETWDTAMDTINLATNKLEMDYASFAICVPYPGTDIYNYAISKGVKMPNWSGFGLVNSPPIPLSDLSVQQLYALRRKATFDFFTRPRYHLRLLKKFKKNIIIRDFAKTGLAVAKEILAGRY
ncbi:MAG: radical SAM protein [Candidatus Omnitrophica bacterium]|nr:radical SAM protein [Candidatus Omnitrophota bacterium]